MTRIPHLLAALPVALLALVACPTWEEVPEPPTPAVDDDDATEEGPTPLVLADEVVVLDEETAALLIEVEGAAEELVFSGSPEGLDGVAVGTILTSAPTELLPYGALQRVLEIQDGGDVTVVLTEPASIDDALESGGIELLSTLGPDDEVTFTPADGVTYDDEGRDSTQIGFGIGGFTFGAGGGTTVYGSFGLASANVWVDAEYPPLWRPDDPKTFDAGFTATVQGTVGVSWDYETTVSVTQKLGTLTRVASQRVV